jgi:TRAP transporter TAXI family solute receptor
MTKNDRFGATRRDFLSTGLAVSGLALGTSFGMGIPPVQAARPLRWGSASPGASGYIIIEALASTVSKYSSVKGSAISTGGAAENMALLGTKEIDLGQTTSWSWTPAKNGEAPFKNKIEPVQMCSYALWSLHPMVLASSDVKTRISPGPAGGVTTYVWKLLFEKAGLADKVDWSYAGWRESYDALRSGAIDCTGTVLVAGKPGGALAELASSHKLRLLDVDPDLIKEVSASNPGAMTYTIKPEMWEAVSKPMDLISVAGILGSVPEVDNDTGYTIVKNIYEHAEEIRKISPVLRLITLDFSTQFLMPAFPVNGGAAKYFQEKGVWRKELPIRA